MLHDFGLPAALRWLAEQMERRQLSVTIELSGQDDLKLPEEQALLLFQSIRELLINASKHSGAGEATVSLARRDGRLRVEVRDRGKGFDIHEKSNGGNPVNFGLFSIRERMMALGGVLRAGVRARKRDQSVTRAADARTKHRWFSTERFEL